MTPSVGLAETNDQRDAIVDGRIPQYEQLREVRLARVLETGCSAVREAVETAAVSQILERPEPVDTSPLRDALAELRKTLMRRAKRWRRSIPIRAQPDLIAEHLRLSARLTGDELARETGDRARASWAEERAMGEEEGTVA